MQRASDSILDNPICCHPGLGGGCNLINGSGVELASRRCGCVAAWRTRAAADRVGRFARWSGLTVAAWLCVLARLPDTDYHAQHGLAINASLLPLCEL